MEEPNLINNILTKIDNICDQLPILREELGKVYDDIQSLSFVACGEDGLIVSNGRTYWLCDPKKNTGCTFRKQYGRCMDCCHMTTNREYRWIPPEEKT